MQVLLVINTAVSGQSSLDSISVGNLNFLTGSYYAFGGNGSDQNYNNTVSTETTYPHVNNQMFIFIIRRVGTTLFFYRNNTSQVVGGGPTTESNTTATFDLNTIGRSSGASELKVAEIAIWNKSIDDADLNAAITDVTNRVGI